MEILPLLVVSGIVALLGSLAGHAIRRLHLRKLRKSNIQKPLYNIVDNLTPAEFGLIVDGAVGYKELVAEIILLAMRGQVTLTKPSSRNPYRVWRAEPSPAEPVAYARIRNQTFTGQQRLDRQQKAAVARPFGCTGYIHA